MVAATERGLLLTCLWYIREVDPQTLLLTGLTRDGVYLVEDGEVVGAVNNFRFNESPVDLLGRVTEVGATERDPAPGVGRLLHPDRRCRRCGSPTSTCPRSARLPKPRPRPVGSGPRGAEGVPWRGSSTSFISRRSTSSIWSAPMCSSCSRRPADRSWLARMPLGYSVTRYEDVVAIFRDRRFHSAVSLITQMSGVEDSTLAIGRRQSILAMEGDEHTRLRRLVAPAFTPASADRLRPFMREVVGGLVDHVAGARPV